MDHIVGTDTGPPQDFATLRELIARRRETMPKRLLQVGEFVLVYPQEVALGTIAKIAALAGVQPSSLVRFAQALGYAGFSELQAVFRSHARQCWPDYQPRMEARRSGPGSSPATLLAGFVQAASASLARVLENCSEPALAHAVDILATAETIHLVGVRRSFPAAAYLAYAMSTLGLRCHLVDQAGGLASEQVELAPVSDALLAISFTPYAPLTVDLAARASRRGVPVVVITDTPFSPLVQSASVWFEVAEGDPGLFRPLSGTFALALTLAVSAADQRADANSPKHKFHS
jgi:DNA-binding MurR/RpiR family transcriptional regulator